MFNSDNNTSAAIRHTPFINLVFDVAFFSLLGIVMAILVDIIIPHPKIGEKVSVSLGWIILQLVIDAIIITSLVKIAPLIFKREADELGGLTAFGILFFATQIQLKLRLKNVSIGVLNKAYRRIGKDLIKNSPTE